MRSKKSSNARWRSASSSETREQVESDLAELQQLISIRGSLGWADPPRADRGAGRSRDDLGGREDRLSRANAPRAGHRTRAIRRASRPTGGASGDRRPAAGCRGARKTVSYVCASRRFARCEGPRTPFGRVAASSEESASRPRAPAGYVATERRGLRAISRSESSGSSGRLTSTTERTAPPRHRPTRLHAVQTCNDRQSGYYAPNETKLGADPPGRA
jgi:hypothetical protein